MAPYKTAIQLDKPQVKYVNYPSKIVTSMIAQGGFSSVHLVNEEGYLGSRRNIILKVPRSKESQNTDLLLQALSLDNPTIKTYQGALEELLARELYVSNYRVRSPHQFNPLRQCYGLVDVEVDGVVQRGLEMEYIPGHTLAEIAAWEIPQKRKIQLLKYAAQAIEFVHRYIGIVGDVKLQNFIVHSPAQLLLDSDTLSEDVLSSLENIPETELLNKVDSGLRDGNLSSPLYKKLYSLNWDVSLIDLASIGVEPMRALWGPRMHLAPEQRQYISPTLETDVWSLGVMIYKFMTNVPVLEILLANYKDGEKIPFDAPITEQLVSITPLYEKLNGLDSKNNTIAKQLSDLTMSMLSYEPKQRPTIEKIVGELESIQEN